MGGQGACRSLGCPSRSLVAVWEGEVIAESGDNALSAFSAAPHLPRRPPSAPGQPSAPGWDQRWGGACLQPKLLSKPYLVLKARGRDGSCPPSVKPLGLCRLPRSSHPNTPTLGRAGRGRPFLGVPRFAREKWFYASELH